MIRSFSVRLAIAVIALHVLGACASTDISAADLTVGMCPNCVHEAQPYGTVMVTAKGIAEGRIYPLPDAVLQKAVADSVIRAGLFSAALEQNAEYSLDVRVVDMPDPESSWTGEMTVSGVIGWTLRRNGDEAPLMEDLVESKCTKTGGDAFVGATRGTMAIVGAVRSNIREGIIRMSRALPGEP